MQKLASIIYHNFQYKEIFMNKCIGRSMNKNITLLFACIFPLTGIATTWNGQLPNGNYENENILITGDTTLGLGDTIVTADSQDITIYVQNKAKLYGNDAGQSRLILRADNGYTIEVIANANFKTAGTSNQLNVPLIIQEEGNGTVRWTVNPGYTVKFGSTSTRGGTLFVVYFNGTVMPKNIFRVTENTDQIRFERNAKWGYKILNLSGTATTQYMITDSENKSADHNQLVLFFDGSVACSYERRVIPG